VRWRPKPVMEGNRCCFKTLSPSELPSTLNWIPKTRSRSIKCVKLMGRVRRINLEDIKAPECFIIEQRLKEEMDIPVFMMTQHGNGWVISPLWLAGLLNALGIFRAK